MDSGILKLLTTPEVKTIGVAMLPIFELRGSIPMALLHLKLAIWPAYFLSVFGNIIAIIPVLLFLGPVSSFLSRFRIFDRFFTWLFSRTRKRSRLVERLELLGLILFVAIPLPMTGAWTGSVAAFLFDFGFPKSLVAIFIGVLIAGIIVTLATLFGWHVFIKIKPICLV
ncbi:MAG: COG2426 family protein [bacterium]